MTPDAKTGIRKCQLNGVFKRFSVCHYAGAGDDAGFECAGDS
jgi:hypothetical protein